MTASGAEAIALLRRALAENGEEPGLWSDLGIAHRHLGQQEEALRCFRQAERLDPHTPIWRLHSANALVEHGAVAEGLELLRRLLADDPGNPQAHWQRAYALLLQGRFEEAWPEFAWR
ncbi:MAG: tetratricopeptide repeat protein, partial [Cyanobacteriota bacterium]